MKRKKTSVEEEKGLRLGNQRKLTEKKLDEDKVKEEEEIRKKKLG